MAGLTGIALALAAAAADLLPLAHGIYVRDRVPCGRAPAVDTLIYPGGERAMESPGRQCRVLRYDVVGPTFRLAVRCQHARSTYPRNAVQYLRMESRTSFSLVGTGRPPVRYRYCGPGVAPRR